MPSDRACNIPRVWPSCIHRTRQTVAGDCRSAVFHNHAARGHKPTRRMLATCVYVCMYVCCCRSLPSVCLRLQRHRICLPFASRMLFRCGVCRLRKHLTSQHCVVDCARHRYIGIPLGNFRHTGAVLQAIAVACLAFGGRHPRRMLGSEKRLSDSSYEHHKMCDRQPTSAAIQAPPCPHRLPEAAKWTLGTHAKPRLDRRHSSHALLAITPR